VPAAAGAAAAATAPPAAVAPAATAGAAAAVVVAATTAAGAGAAAAARMLLLPQLLLAAVLLPLQLLLSLVRAFSCVSFAHQPPVCPVASTLVVGRFRQPRSRRCCFCRPHSLLSAPSFVCIHLMRTSLLSVVLHHQ